jgi:uncharacterized membrane protein
MHGAVLKDKINIIPPIKGMMVKDIRHDMERTAPPALIIVGLIALFFASFYLYRLFGSMPAAIENENAAGIMMAICMILIMFILYTNYLITIFRLSSGSRKAWAGMIRMTFTYIIMALLSTYGLNRILPVQVFGGGSYITWITAAVMVAMVIYMHAPQVRRFFTPGYADEVPLRDWIRYIAGADPFRGEKMIVSAEDPYA